MESSQTFDIMAMAKSVARRRKARRVAQALVGGALVATGIGRRGWFTPLFVLGGAALVLRGTTERRLGEALRHWWRWAQLPRARRFGGGTRDMVDEASWQSFPARYPPGYSVGSRARGHFQQR